MLSEIVMKLVKQNRIKQKNQYRKQNLSQEKKKPNHNNKQLRQNTKTFVINVEIKIYPSNFIGD